MQKKNYVAFFILCGIVAYFGCSQDSMQFEWRKLESNTG